MGATEAETELRASVEAVIEAALAAPAGRRVAGTWTAHDVLAHLVFWHSEYADILEARLSGAGPPRPRTTLKALNAQAVRTSRDVPLDLLAERLRSAQARLAGVTRDPRTASAIVQLTATSTPRPWSEFAPLVESHLRRHAAELRRPGGAPPSRPALDEVPDQREAVATRTEVRDDLGQG